MSRLPEPACRYGFTWQQVEDILGDRVDEFSRFMRGQTVSLCDGREYDYAAGGWRDTGCGPHGTAVYTSDLRHFLAGRRPLD